MHQCLCRSAIRGHYRYVKLFLALLAILTGFSVADSVRVAEQPIAQGDGAVRGAWSTDETRPAIAMAAALLAATIIPVLLLLLPSMGWRATPRNGRIVRTVYRSDRLRQ